MNPLLEQFLIEGRELLDGAVQALLQVERGEGGPPVIDTLFRAVHTLKGTSGLFDVAPLSATVHAGEDLLDAVRSGRLALDAASVDLLLAALDQTRNWLDDLERTEALPGDAEAVAAKHAAALRARLGAGAAAGPAPARAAVAGVAPDWVAALPQAERLAAEQAAAAADRDVVAILYRPDTGCFFRGEDPLLLVRQVPDLLALALEAPGAWPPLDVFDPFECVLAFRLLSSAPVEELRHLFRYCGDDVTIAAYAPPRATGAHAPEWPVAAELLAQQMRLLLAPCDPGMVAGRAASVAAVLRRVGGHCGFPPEDPAAVEAALAQAAEGDPAPLSAMLQAQHARCAQPSPGPPLEPEHRPAEPGAARPAGPVTLRVDQARIDTLMNLIGELIVAKNSLSYLARKAESGASARELARDIKDQQALVNRLAEDMQSAVMAIRMLPVSHVFQRFPRLVRDIARKLDKQVGLELAGEDTEADKNMIEALSDPLVHMVRNSLDHGLEPPAERIAAGKPPTGTIRLAAEQSNECITVTVQDDGRGIDPARMRRKAVERGILDEAAAAALPDADALRLVFAPGLSTAEQISDLSGRGVGMDVVRSTVERVGGQVHIASELGKGTSVRVVVPLSMAVTRILTIECAGQMFGIPMGAVVENVRLPASAIRRIQDAEAFVLRDRIVPLLRLVRLLNLPGGETAPDADVPVLVLRTPNTTAGLVIDAFRERMEAIVRPLDGSLAGLREFAGTTLLGDGRVLLVLDVAELI